MASANQQLALKIVAQDLASATISKVEGGMEQFTRTAARSTAASGQFSGGLARASGALQGLAGNLLGANEKLTGLVAGLGTAGLGGPAVAGAAAAVAVVAGAVALFTKAAREAKAAADEMVASYLKMADANAPEGLRSGQVISARLEELRGQFERLRTVREEAKSRGLLTGDLDARLAELATQIGQARRALAEARGGAVVLEELTVTARRSLAGAAQRPPTVAPDRNVAFRDSTAMGATPEQTAAMLEAANAATLMGDAVGRSNAMIGVGGEIMTRASETMRSFADDMVTLAEVTTAAGAAMAGLGSVAGEGVAKAAQKLLAPLAKIEGTYFVVKGLAKMADGLFPPNPALIASGSAMVARGQQLLALAKGGGGIAGAAGGGAGNGADREKAAKTTSEQKGETVIVMKKQPVMTDDPALVDFIADIMRNAGNRRVTFQYT